MRYLILLCLLAGCSKPVVGTRFRMMESVQAHAMKEDNGKSVLLTLPKGCVISVLAEEKRAVRIAERKKEGNDGK